MKKEKDIFDRIMELPVLRIFNPFYKKNKEILLYLFFGGLTFLVSIISYAFFNIQIGWNALIANIGSWILAVSFAYVTNRIWVFDSNAETIADFIKEIWLLSPRGALMRHFFQIVLTNMRNPARINVKFIQNEPQR